ncbi:MAG: DNRLRE domain-containing protein [Dehalococcoidia bacterium]
MRLTKWGQWAVLVLVGVALLLAGACARGNSPPQIISVSADPVNLAPGEISTLTCVASDPDGDTLTYSWRYSGPCEAAILETGSTVDWTVAGALGTYTVTVTVNDGKGGTAEGSCYVTVAVVLTMGTLDAKSSPAGATVYIDGTDTGNITPYVITGVDEGDHTIKLSKELCKDREETVTVTAGETTYVNWELDPAPPQTVTVQPDAAEGKDAPVISTDPTTNMGSLELLVVGDDGINKARTYIRFSLPGIPVTAVVTSVDLLLWYGDSSDAVATTVDAYQVTEAWAENTITWDDQPVHSPAACGSSLLPDIGTNDFVAWEIETGLIEGWVDGSIANHGFVLIDADEDISGALKLFLSSDHVTVDSRPKLVITYYDPAP